jgi:cell division protein FtsL
MAKNRKNQAASIRFGPALKAMLLCLLIAGSAVGYVWQKSQVFQLGKQIREMETHLTQVVRDNQTLGRQIDDLSSKVNLEARARALGLAPAQPGQVVRLSDAAPGTNCSRNPLGQLAARPAGSTLK